MNGRGRFDYERGVMASELPPPARLVALVLAAHANPDGRIPDEFTPSLTRLSTATGLARRTVTEHLNILESTGWIVRTVPNMRLARSKKVTTKYRLTAPASAGDSLATSAGDALDSAGDALALGHLTTSARAGAAHNQPKNTNHLQPRRDAHELAAAIAEKVNRKMNTTVTTGTALKWMQTIDTEGKHDPVAYVVAIVTKPENRQRYLGSTPTPPPWAQVRAQMESA